jgi:SMC interacting uncharacterized protein involved in chromosome segregation
MRQDVLAFLQANAFDITMATLTNIAAKDFRTIFTFLVYALDPETQLEDVPNFQEIFVPHLKALRYPFAHQIDNKWLAAPASMHSWPSLLGVLHWLVEMCKVCQEDHLPCTLLTSLPSSEMTIWQVGTQRCKILGRLRLNSKTPWIMQRSLLITLRKHILFG